MGGKWGRALTPIHIGDGGLKEVVQLWEGNRISTAREMDAVLIYHGVEEGAGSGDSLVQGGDHGGGGSQVDRRVNVGKEMIEGRRIGIFRYLWTVEEGV